MEPHLGQVANVSYVHIFGVLDCNSCHYSLTLKVHRGYIFHPNLGQLFSLFHYFTSVTCDIINVYTYVPDT